LVLIDLLRPHRFAAGVSKLRLSVFDELVVRESGGATLAWVLSRVSSNHALPDVPLTQGQYDQPRHEKFVPHAGRVIAKEIQNTLPNSLLST
jgi:hypothetical protein